VKDVPPADRDQKKRAYAHLTVLSDLLSPAEMEEALDMTPDISWTKGDPHRGGKSQQKFNGVVFESTLDRERSEPSEHIEDLLRTLTANVQRIRRLAGDDRVHSARLWFYWNTSAGNPGLTFPHETVRAIANLGVSLDLDIYVLPDETTNPPQRS
jgi:hypothetical protein